MKKLTFHLMMVLFTTLCFGQTNEAFQKDVLKYLQLSGSSKVMESMLQPIIKDMTPEKRTAFLTELDAQMPLLYDKLAVVFMQEFTHDEIKAILKFYKTPAGKKLSSKAGEMTEKSVAVSKEWSKGIQEILLKYMQ